MPYLKVQKGSAPIGIWRWQIYPNWDQGGTIMKLNHTRRVRVALFVSTLTTIIAFGILLTASPVLAKTPDGNTPAQETVCDPLHEAGITKGLYGLCVAFCEAGDYADEYDTITPEELATLRFSTPSGRILAN